MPSCPTAILVILLLTTILAPCHAVAERGVMDVKTDELKRPPAASRFTPPALRLQGVVAVDGRAVAIINRGLYREGDVVAGMVVSRISVTGVILEREGRRYELVMEGAE